MGKKTGLALLLGASVALSAALGTAGQAQAVTVVEDNTMNYTGSFTTGFFILDDVFTAKGDKLTFYGNLARIANPSEEDGTVLSFDLFDANNVFISGQQLTNFTGITGDLFDGFIASVNFNASLVNGSEYRMRLSSNTFYLGLGMDANGGNPNGYGFVSGTPPVSGNQAPCKGPIAQSCDASSIRVFETAAVPEPGTWALMIAGFGLAGAALRRRRPQYA